MLAVYEFHFRRKDVMNPTGLIGVVVGIALGLAGVWQLHNTDGAGANTIGAALIGAGMLVGFIGWGVWRYAPHTQSGTTAGRPDGVTAPLIAGVICFVAAILVGTWMDAQNGEDLTEAFDLGGGTSLAIAIVVALVAMIWSAGTGGAAAGNVIGSAISAQRPPPSERPGPESSPRASWRSSPPSASSTSPPSRAPGRSSSSPSPARPSSA